MTRRPSYLHPGSPPRRFGTGITVELSEILRVGDDATSGEYELSPDRLAEEFGEVDPIDADCPAALKCIGMLTRVRVDLIQEWFQFFISVVSRFSVFISQNIFGKSRKTFSFKKLCFEALKVFQEI